MSVNLLVAIAAVASFVQSASNVPSSINKSTLTYSINSQFDEFCKEYSKQFGKNWTGGRAIGQKPLTNDSSQTVGKIVCFEKGYICVTEDSRLLEFSDEKKPYAWNSLKQYVFHKKRVLACSNNRYYTLSGESTALSDLEDYPSYSAQSISSYFHEIDEVRGYGDFRLSYCLTPFTAIPEALEPGKVSFATWNSYCMEQGNRICMTCAVVNLLLTYKYSTGGVVDCTKGLTPEQMYDQISSGTVNGENGSFEPTFTFDVNKYMDGTGYYLNISDGEFRGFAPYISNYHFNGDLLHGHTVLVIGEASTHYWWIFRSYWDIVLTWERNYNVSSSGNLTLDLGDSDAIRLVDQQYSTGGYCLCRNGLLVTQGNAGSF